MKCFFRETEAPEQAALCHNEMANLYEKLQNSALEIRHLVYAAHLFEKARITRHEMAMTGFI